MKLNIKQLQKIIKEETNTFLSQDPEYDSDDPSDAENWDDFRQDFVDVDPLDDFEDFYDDSEDFRESNLNEGGFADTSWIGADGMITDSCPMCSNDRAGHDASGCDYEQCGHCNFDHSYEPEEANQWHSENDPSGDLYK